MVYLAGCEPLCVGQEPLMIDLYCERTGPEFWSEPLNALSNASFLAAFLFLLPICRRIWQDFARGVRLALAIQLLLLFCIFVGSSSFHTLATRPTMLADIIPISLFQLVFLGAYCRQVVQWPWPIVVLVLALFLIATTLLGKANLPLNGSQTYLAPLAFLTALGVFHYLKVPMAQFHLLAAAGVFLASLTFRSIDNAICELMPIGTHFTWHLLNGIVLALCVLSFLAGVRWRAGNHAQNGSV